MTATETHRIAAIGMFDGVHAGHRSLLGYLRREGELRHLKAAVVTFNNHPAELVAADRAPRLLMTPRDKIGALRAEGVEDIILLHFDEALRRLSAREFMTMLHASYGVDCLVVGYDHRFGRDRLDGFDDYVAIGREIGLEVIRAPEESGFSSTAVRDSLLCGHVEAATALLGRTYYIDGTVVAGKRLGRTIGFPTANLAPLSDRILIPARGVYVADVSIDGSPALRRSMLNIGHRPTVDSPDAPDTIEVHVIDYEGDLYGHLMRVHFLHRLRSERAFGSLESLRKQLCADRDAAIAWI